MRNTKGSKFNNFMAFYGYVNLINDGTIVKVFPSRSRAEQYILDNNLQNHVIENSRADDCGFNYVNI